MSTGEGSFNTTREDEIRVQKFPERRFALKRHNGPVSTVEKTRKPLYQHMISGELVGGPPVLRFDLGDLNGDQAVDVLVGATCGFDGDEEVTVELFPAADYAVLDFEGPTTELPAARLTLIAWAKQQGRDLGERILQIHMMDEIDGETEQQLQIRLA
jgi:effector-binding domain-containing protein